MDKIKLEIGLPQIDYIIHTADIHVRTMKRHTEYRLVFSRFYDKCRDIVKKHPNTVIYLGGDIVHAKLDITPELVREIANFFKSLADIAPTLIIMGNHDTNLNNNSRLDALTPIIDALAHENLHYMKDSGVYDICGIDFTVMSVFDTPDEFIGPEESTSDLKIAFHHGAVNNAKTEFGFSLFNDEVTPETFDGYDLVLLGDIHRRQSLQPHSIEEIEVDEDELQSYLDDGWEIVDE